MVGHHPTNKLIGREPIPHQKHQKRRNLSQAHHATDPEYPVLATLSCGYPEEGGRLLTCYSPVRHSSRTSKLIPSPFDLHVLSTPPAFVLSQDQTLQTKPTKPGPNQPQTASQNPQSVQQSRKPDQAQPNPKKKEGQANQNKTNPKRPHTTKIMRSPQGHGIKNMTHYRVLKQHTHRDLRPGRIPCLPLEGDRTSISRLSFGNQIRIA